MMKASLSIFRSDITKTKQLVRGDCLDLVEPRDEHGGR